MSTSNKHHRYGMLSTVRTTSTHCRLILGHTSAKTELHRIRGSRHHEQKRCGSGLRATGGESQGFPPSQRLPTPTEQTRTDSSWSAMKELCLRKQQDNGTGRGRDEGTQPRTSVHAEPKGNRAHDSAGQSSQAEGRSGAAKQSQLTSSRTQLAQ